MDKRQVIDELRADLARELKELQEALEEGGHVERADQIMRQLLMLKHLPVRRFSGDDPICASGLVELELNGLRSFYLIVPSGGGLVTRIAGRAVQVITPQSPLGEVLLGRRAGESVVVTTTTGTRTYKIISFS